MRLNEHPLRRQVVGEMHLRRWPRLAPPAQILQVLRIVAPQDRAAERAMLDDLPLNGHLAPSDNARHAEGELGPGLSFAWEQHSEACGITLFVRDPAVDVAPALAWIERFPGEVIRATRIHLVATEAEAEALLPDLDFVGSDLVSCHIGAASLERPVRLWSDFRVGPEGLGISLVAANGAPSGDLARLLQRFQELGNYRNLALMGLPVAQGNWGRLDADEAALRQLAGDVARPEITDDALLEQVSALSLDLMSLSTETSYRMSATAAYAQLVEERLAGLSVRAIAGYPSLEDFTQRRLLPAIRTVQAYSRRLDDLTARAAHFTSLLRTRVETRIENQNGRLLRSLERSSSLQLRLQQLVEGLSVVALSYYGISLIGYMLKAAEHRFEHFPAAEIVGALVPVVVITMWLGLHRMKARVLGEH